MRKLSFLSFGTLLLAMGCRTDRQNSYNPIIGSSTKPSTGGGTGNGTLVKSTSSNGIPRYNYFYNGSKIVEVRDASNNIVATYTYNGDLISGYTDYEVPNAAKKVANFEYNSSNQMVKAIYTQYDASNSITSRVLESISWSNPSQPEAQLSAIDASGNPISPQTTNYMKINFILQNGNLVKMTVDGRIPNSINSNITRSETTYVYDTAHKNPYANLTGLDKILYGLPGGVVQRATNFATKVTLSNSIVESNGTVQQGSTSTSTVTLNAVQYNSFTAPLSGSSEIRTVFPDPSMPPMVVNSNFEYAYQ